MMEQGCVSAKEAPGQKRQRLEVPGVTPLGEFIGWAMSRPQRKLPSFVYVTSMLLPP